LSTIIKQQSEPKINLYRTWRLSECRLSRKSEQQNTFHLSKITIYLLSLATIKIHITLSMLKSLWFATPTKTTTVNIAAFAVVY
jgi:hypothetical protein